MENLTIIDAHAHLWLTQDTIVDGIQHLADRPEAYLAQPSEVLGFLSSLPSVWDDTHLLSGYPGHHAIIARRNGDKLYIAGINGTDNVIKIKPDYSALNLPASIDAKMFADSGDRDNPWLINSVSSLPEEVTLLPRGGFVIRFSND